MGGVATPVLLPAMRARKTKPLVQTKPDIPLIMARIGTFENYSLQSKQFSERKATRHRAKPPACEMSCATLQTLELLYVSTIILLTYVTKSRKVELSTNALDNIISMLFMKVREI
jgi:hypothetical protein